MAHPDDAKAVTTMPDTVEIAMTARGFEVTVGGHTARFPSIDDAFEFAQRRLRHAKDLRELSARCE